MEDPINQATTPSPLADEKQPHPTEKTQQGEEIVGWRLAIIFFCLAVCLLLAFMDETIVATALVDISIEFDNFQISLWIVLAYTITFTGFTVLACRLADVYGRRNVHLVGAVIFIAFSFGSAFSQNMQQLIAFRALQGVGGSILYSIGILCFPELSPLRLLPLASSIVGIVVAIAGAAGPTLGGVFTSYVNWRWVFWINPPIAIPIVVVLYFAWPKGPPRGAHLAQIHISQVDWFGTVLLLLFTTCFTISIQQAGSRVLAWNSATVIALLTIGCSSLVALLVWSWTLTQSTRFKNLAGILPWRMMTDRVLSAAIITTLLTGFTGLLSVVWLPIYFQIVNVLSPVEAGVHLLPSLCASAIGGAVGGLTSAKKNHTWITLLAGTALLLVGAALFSIAPVSLSVPNIIYASQVVGGFGAGITFTVTTILVSLNAEFHDHALGQGLIAQSRVIGGTLGVAMGSALFGNHISGLTDVLTADEISTLYRNPAFIATLDLQQQVAVREAFALSFNESMRICTYIGAVSFVVALFVWQRNPPTVQGRKEQLEVAISTVAVRNDM